jgi:hypothetical protein
VKISNKEFVHSIYPTAFAYQGIGARYTILSGSFQPVEYLSGIRSTENSAWADAARNLKSKEQK